jgi:hypothetical protein
MEDIAAFLLARIAEDEANVRSWAQEAAVAVLTRALAECEAKRRLIEHVQRLGRGAGAQADLEMFLKIMAVPYAGHPAYRNLWRP